MSFSKSKRETLFAEIARKSSDEPKPKSTGRSTTTISNFNESARNRILTARVEELKSKFVNIYKI